MPSGPASGASWSQMAPNINFFYECGSKVPPVTRTLCKTCKYIVLHQFSTSYWQGFYCLGKTRWSYALVQVSSRQLPQMVHCTNTSLATTRISIFRSVRWCDGKPLYPRVKLEQPLHLLDVKWNVLYFPRKYFYSTSWTSLLWMIR